MRPEDVLQEGVWVGEVMTGVEHWGRYTTNFFNSGEGAMLDYLHRQLKMNVIAGVKDAVWCVWCQGQGDADSPLVQWLSVQCYGECMREAMAVAAGLLEGIARDEIEYSLTTERQGVALAC